MNETLNDNTKQVGDALIDMSIRLAEKMDMWSNVVVSEGSLRNAERAGFVNKTSADTGVDLVIDIQAPKDSTEAVLRTWAVDGSIGDDGTKVFNNIQLTFTVVYDKARLLTERFDTVTRDDIRTLLHETDTLLQAVVISNQSGLDEATEKTYGQRYDVTANEIDEQGITDEICGTLNTVLEALHNAADAEVS